MSSYAMMNALMAPDLTPAQSKVWAYLIFRANGARVCWPKVDDIAADLNLSKRAVIEATNALAGKPTKKGESPRTVRIKITSRYKDTNNYHVLDVAGLHERPSFKDRRPASRASMPYDDRAEDAIEPGVQKTTPEKSEVQKTTPEGDSRVQKTTFSGAEFASESIQQEREQESESVARVREDDFTPAPTPPVVLVAAREAQPEAAASDCAMIGKVWDSALKRWVDPPQPAPVARPRSHFEANIAALGRPNPATGECEVEGINVRHTLARVCEIVGIKPDAHPGDEMQVRKWLAAKVAPEDIYAALRHRVVAIRRNAGDEGYRPPRAGLAYFVKAVDEWRGIARRIPA